MNAPNIQDVFWETTFAIGGAFTRAAASGATDDSLFRDYRQFWNETAVGLTLVSWCHFVETILGGREKLINKTSDSNDKQLIRILFYARNAFVHCAWDISDMDKRMGQEAKIRRFVGTGYTHPRVSVFSISIDSNSKLTLTGFQNLGQVILANAS